MTLHCMVDLETLGVQPDAAILSIGAVLFHPEGSGIGAEFYEVTKLGGSISVGMTVDDSTLNWWFDQSEEARHAISKADKVSLLAALTQFKQFYDQNKPDHLWAHGTAFDVAILHAAYARHSMPHPWSYRSSRDTRTLYEAAGYETNGEDYGFLTAHNALSDAKRQAMDVQRAWRKLKGMPQVPLTCGREGKWYPLDAPCERKVLDAPAWADTHMAPQGEYIGLTRDNCLHSKTKGYPDGSASCFDCGAILPDDLKEHHNDSAHGAEFPMPRHHDFTKVG